MSSPSRTIGDAVRKGAGDDGPVVIAIAFDRAVSMCLDLIAKPSTMPAERESAGRTLQAVCGARSSYLAKGAQTP